MRHIIAHLVRGEAKDYHINLTKDLVEKFEVFPIHNRIPPHLTLKRWFEIDVEDMTDLYDRLTVFAAQSKQSDYSFKGFGNFGKDVIFVDAIPSVEMSERIQELMTMLHEIKNMKFDEYDNGSDFHATVTLGALKTFDYDEIWNYLQTIEQPNFAMKFDNIATMKKVNGKWVVDRVWEISKN